MNTSKVGQVAAALMDRMAEGYAEIEEEAGAECVVGEVLVIAEIQLPATLDDPAGRTAFGFRCSDDRLWIQRAMIRECLDGRAGSWPDDEEPDDDA